MQAGTIGRVEAEVRAGRAPATGSTRLRLPKQHEGEKQMSEIARLHVVLHDDGTEAAKLIYNTVEGAHINAIDLDPAHHAGLIADAKAVAVANAPEGHPLFPTPAAEGAVAVAGAADAGAADKGKKKAPVN
jgi:hypothetical protein